MGTIIIIIIAVLTLVGLWFIFEKAGYKGWMAIIPFYNLYIWLKIIGKPIWWYILLLVPFINIFMLFLMLIETAKGFLKFGFWHQGLAALFPFVYMPYLGLSKDEKWHDVDERPKFKKSPVREWADAIIFAVVAAMIIRTFFMEAYQIPTSSMEKSLLIGDFLFVSKMAYGPKRPNTPIAFPFVHHTLPLSENKKSYVEWIKLPYKRYWGFREIKNNDVVVFNYPDGDTVALRQQDRSYYALTRQYGRDKVWNDKYHFGDVIARPVDKRENYIKRCIGIPGDSLTIVDQQVYVNGKPQVEAGKKQYQYYVKTGGATINPKSLDKLDINPEDRRFMNDGLLPILTEESAKVLEKNKAVKEVTKIVYPKDQFMMEILPHDSSFVKWNQDNFGPVYIPKRGDIIPIDMFNISIYDRIIEVYEGNKLEIKGDQIFINGEIATTYEVKMDYYWMMGDNRHNSADSRFWGFVPEDHIVGKAVFVWLSLDKNKSLFGGKMRWRKMFRVIK